jgi:hypothetical protein
MPELSVQRRTREGDLIAVVADLVIADCVSPVQDASGRLMVDFLEDVLPSGPRWLLVSIGPDVPGASLEMQRALAETLERNQAHIRAFAIVMRVSGFRAAIHRCIGAAIRGAIRVGYPREYFPAVEDAASWLSGLGSSMGPSDIVNSALDLRAQSAELKRREDRHARP